VVFITVHGCMGVVMTIGCCSKRVIAGHILVGVSGEMAAK